MLNSESKDDFATRRKLQSDSSLDSGCRGPQEARNLLRKIETYSGPHSIQYGGLNFEVNKKVFNPFLTNTSLWFADTIIRNFPRNPRHILEYGIGSGVVASLVYLNLNALKLFGIDSSKDAVQLARTNLKRNGINAEVELDWTLQSAKLYKYDLAICNPPLLNVQSSSLLEDSIFDHGLPTTKHFLDSVQDLLAINGVGFLLVSDREVGGVSGEKLLDDYKFAKPLARKNCGYEIYSCYVISKNA